MPKKRLTPDEQIRREKWKGLVYLVVVVAVIWGACSVIQAQEPSIIETLIERVENLTFRVQDSEETIESLVDAVRNMQSPAPANWVIYAPPPNLAQSYFGGGTLLMFDTTTGAVVAITNNCGRGVSGPCIRNVPVLIPPAQ